MMAVLMFFVFMAMSVTVYAQVLAPDNVEGFVTIIPKFLEAIALKNYTFAGAVIVMFVVVSFRQFVLPKLKVGTELLPVIAVLVGQVLSVLQSLTVPNPGKWQDVVLQGLVWALLGSGLWSALGKAIAKKLLGDKFVLPEVK